MKFPHEILIISVHLIRFFIALVGLILREFLEMSCRDLTSVCDSIVALQCRML